MVRIILFGILGVAQKFLIQAFIITTFSQCKINNSIFIIIKYSKTSTSSYLSMHEKGPLVCVESHICNYVYFYAYY